jgi:putative membrane protein
MRKTTLTALGIALAAGLSMAYAQTKLAHADVSFMKDAAEAGAAEIEASQLAQTKAKNAATKTFAQQMIADHTKVADTLKQLAAAKQVELPDGPSVAQKAKLKLIDAGDDNKFDARYAKTFGVEAHRDTIKLFQKAAAGAKDPDVKAFAQQTLPGLQHHLDMAQRLEKTDTAMAPAR